MEIKFNGHPLQTTCRSLQELHDSCAPAAAMTILNGYATTQDLALHDGDEVFCIEKNRLPSQEALESMMCARHTPHVHEKIRHSCVGIAGLGGLGSHVAIFLARMGIGTLHLVDFDTVDVSNLNRQAYRICDLGAYKADALEAQIRDINPFIKIRKDMVRVTRDNAAQLFAADQVVCEAFDNPESKALLIDVLLQQTPSKYIVAASGMAGYGESNAIQTHQVTDHFIICGDRTSAARPGMGLMAPRVAICAGHEANAILKVLVGIQQ